MIRSLQEKPWGDACIAWLEQGNLGKGKHVLQFAFPGIVPARTFIGHTDVRSGCFGSSSMLVLERNYAVLVMDRGPPICGDRNVL